MNGLIANERELAEQAYDQFLSYLEDAWRGPNAGTRQEEPAWPTDVTAATQQETGEPRRVRVPLLLKDDAPHKTADEGQRLADAAYEEFCQYLETAYLQGRG